MSFRDAITTYRPSPVLPGAAGEKGDLSAVSLLGTCWRRRWTVLAMVVLALTAAAVYLSVTQKQYTSRARLYAQQNGPRLLAQGADPSMQQSDAYLFRQGEVIKSEPILKQVIATLNTESAPVLMASANPLGQLERNLSVSAGKKDEIISIEFTSLDPAEAQAVVNTVVDAYRQYCSSTNQSSAVTMSKVLGTEKEKQEKLLDEKQKQIVAFKQQNGEMFFNTDRGTNIMVQNLATISDQLTRAKLAATAAKADYEQSNSKPFAMRRWQDAERQTKEYERLYEAEKAKALKITDALAEFDNLQTDAARTMKLLDVLDSRIKELSVTQDAGAMNIQVLEWARREERPTSPKKAITLLAALAFGLTLGGAAAVAHELLDQRVHAPDDSGRLLGLPVLGMIPIVRHAVASARKQLGRSVHLAPNSNVAEAYRTLRAAVYYGWPDRSVKSVLVTSPDRGDGKSTTASNLAIAMAQAGIKTLLIDADLRAAVQHKIFDVSNSVGLSDVVARGVSLENALRPSGVDGLDVLPSGTPTPAPAEITNSQAFGRLLQQLEAGYDLVVIDSPPLLSVADARILGAQAGLTILTLRADKSTRQDVRQACQQLLGVGSSILGIVLNGVVQRRRSYAYYGSEDSPVANGPPDRSLPGKDAGAHALTY